ncbi:MAG: hypothetical protein LDL41_03740 [Coleofasciculus sp. S288]|nr:hypothetical protein [Coleofasciculus sp. S288]
MKKRSLLNVTLAISMLGFATFPALAETRQSNTPLVFDQVVTIPQSTAIVVAFPSNVEIPDVENMQKQPITLILVQPLLDKLGNEVVPANSPINGQLEPSENGVRVLVNSIVVHGRVVPIQSSSLVIPGQVRSASRSREFGQAVSSLGAGIGDAFGRPSNPSSDAPTLGDQLAAGGAVLGTLIGAVSPRKAHTVMIPQGSVYMLTLQTPVTLPGAANL